MKKQFSPASLISIAGGILAITGLISYFNDATNLSVPTFFYGVPILLIGLALKNSELDPTNNSISASDISKLNNKKVIAFTSIKKVNNFKNFDVIILAIKPQIVNKVLNQLVNLNLFRRKKYLK